MNIILIIILLFSSLYCSQDERNLFEILYNQGVTHHDVEQRSKSIHRRMVCLEAYLQCEIVSKKFVDEFDKLQKEQDVLKKYLEQSKKVNSITVKKD